MIGDVYYYQQRYDSLEEEFLMINEYIPLTDNFKNSNYNFGSPKLLDFSFKVCREIETIFRLILKDKSFDGKVGIVKARKKQNIKIYRKYIEPEYKFHEYKLTVMEIKKEIIPFENFNKAPPDWFKKYSKHKHNTLKLINMWNLKDSLYSLAALGLLVLNHPDYRCKKIPHSTDYYTRIFYGKDVRPRFSIMPTREKKII